MYVAAGWSKNNNQTKLVGKPWEGASARSCVWHCLEDVWLLAKICSEHGVCIVGGIPEAG